MGGQNAAAWVVHEQPVVSQQLPVPSGETNKNTAQRTLEEMKAGRKGETLTSKIVDENTSGLIDGGVACVRTPEPSIDVCFRQRRTRVGDTVHCSSSAANQLRQHLGRSLLGGGHANAGFVAFALSAGRNNRDRRALTSGQRLRPTPCSQSQHYFSQNSNYRYSSTGENHGNAACLPVLS
jgi:hypothetical protein